MHVIAISVRDSHCHVKGQEGVRETEGLKRRVAEVQAPFSEKIMSIQFFISVSHTAYW